MFKANNKDTRTTPGVVLVSLLLTLNIFQLGNDSGEIRWYLISMDNIESRLYIEKTSSKEKVSLEIQYKCHINFTNKAFYY